MTVLIWSGETKIAGSTVTANTRIRFNKRVESETGEWPAL
jgi:hypothetical protein